MNANRPITPTAHQNRPKAIIAVIQSWRMVHPNSLPTMERAQTPGERKLVTIYQQLMTSPEFQSI